MIQSSDSFEAKLPQEEFLAPVRTALHALLAQLVRAASEKAHHRVMFLSPEAGDGTTTIATSTSMVLARYFRRNVTLVEANLHNPGIAGLLNIPGRPGILDVVDGSSSIEQALRSSALRGFHVLPCGGTRPPLDGELADDSVQRVISDACATQQFTIIDAPPVLEHPESCMLLQHVDEVVLVIRAGATRKKRAEAAIQIIQDAGVTVSGVFLNRFKSPLPFGLARFVKS